jgi:DNA-binding CsgD family transcriptional regulator
VIAGSLTTLYIRYAIRRNTKTFEEQEQKRLAQLNNQEKQIATLKSERLQADLSHKSKELASATMLIINHEDFLNDLKKDIQQNALTGKIQKKQSEQLIEKINQNLSEEDEWSVFQENFDLIHKNFFRNLKSTYPDLTPADLRLCALLRLNYTTKEIARMQNLSLRGVEAARYRLRKKIDIQENEDLVSFMINFF